MKVASLVGKVSLEGADKAKRDLEDVKSGFSDAATGARGFGSVMDMVGGAIGGLSLAGLAVGLKNVVQETYESALQFGVLSQQVGASVDFLAAFSEAASDVGVRGEAASAAMNMLAIKMESLGKTDAEQAIYDAADAIAAVGPGAQAASIAMDYFGRQGKQLIPILLQGSAALKENIANIQAFGNVITGTDVKAMQELRDKVDNLNDQLDRLKLNVARQVTPAVIDLATQTEKAIRVNSLMAAGVQAEEKALKELFQTGRVSVSTAKELSTAVQGMIGFFREGDPVLAGFVQQLWEGSRVAQSYATSAALMAGANASVEASFGALKTVVPGTATFVGDSLRDLNKESTTFADGWDKEIGRIGDAAERNKPKVDSFFTALGKGKTDLSAPDAKLGVAGGLMQAGLEGGQKGLADATKSLEGQQFMGLLTSATTAKGGITPDQAAKLAQLYQKTGELEPVVAFLVKDAPKLEGMVAKWAKDLGAAEKMGGVTDSDIQNLSQWIETSSKTVVPGKDAQKGVEKAQAAANLAQQQFGHMQWSAPKLVSGGQWTAEQSTVNLLNAEETVDKTKKDLAAAVAKAKPYTVLVDGFKDEFPQAFSAELGPSIDAALKLTNTDALKQAGVQVATTIGLGMEVASTTMGVLNPALASILTTAEGFLLSEDSQKKMEGGGKIIMERIALGVKNNGSIFRKAIEAEFENAVWDLAVRIVDQIVQRRR